MSRMELHRRWSLTKGGYELQLGLATPRYAIIGIYFFVVLAIGLWIGSKTKSDRPIPCR